MSRDEKVERFKELHRKYIGEDVSPITADETDEHDRLKVEIEQEEKVAGVPESGEDAGKSGKTFWITRHYSYDSSPKNALAGISESDWVEMMKDMVKDIYAGGAVDFMACIFHDKDLDEETGAPVTIHFHTFVRFKKSQAQPFVIDLFGTSSPENTQKVNNNLGMSRYVIHVSDDAIEKNKTIYPRDKVFTFNCDYNELVKDKFWNKAKNDDDPHKLMDKNAVEKLVTSLAFEIKEGKLRKSAAIDILEEKAGYHWARMHRNSFDGDQMKYVEKRVEIMTEKGRDNKNIYIMGPGGIGKSNLGRKLGVRQADGKGLHITAALGKGKTPDALNNYTDEQVALFNELSPYGWSLDEFLSCFDFFEYAPFPSRNENKDFVGDTCIFTNSISPLRFANDLVVYSKGGSTLQDPANKTEIDYRNQKAVDKYWQVRRRFFNKVILVRDDSDSTIVHANVFNLRYGVLRADGKVNMDDGTHVLVGSVSYKCTPGEEPTIDGETLEKLERLLSINTTSMFQNVTTIDEFLEARGLNEPEVDPLMSDFVENVVSECVWSLLPTTFLYELYRSFQMRYYISETPLNIQEFAERMRVLLAQWEWKKDVRTTSKMSLDEPLISEYNLKNWFSEGYYGANVKMKRSFRRKPKYSGFVKK